MSAPIAAPPKPVLTPRSTNLKFLKASEAAGKQGLCMLIYGTPGSGKTTLAASAQDSEYGRDVAFIDADGGIKSLEDRNDIDVMRLERYAQLTEVANAIRGGDLPYKTVVIDTLSEAQARDMLEITKTAGREGMPQQQDWLKSSNHLMGVMRSYRDLAYGPRAINVIFTAHVKEATDEAGNVVGIRPQMTPSARDIAIGAVDVLAYLTFHPKTGKRILSFGGSALYWAKVRQGITRISLPNKLDDPTMPEILRFLRESSKKEGSL